MLVASLFIESLKLYVHRCLAEGSRTFAKTKRATPPRFLLEKWLSISTTSIFLSCCLVLLFSRYPYYTVLSVIVGTKFAVLFYLEGSKALLLLHFLAQRLQRGDFLSLYFKMTYFPLLSHFSASYNQSNNTFKLIKAPEFVVPLSYGTQFVVLSVSPSRTLS